MPALTPVEYNPFEEITIEAKVNRTTETKLTPVEHNPFELTPVEHDPFADAESKFPKTEILEQGDREATRFNLPITGGREDVLGIKSRFEHPNQPVGKYRIVQPSSNIEEFLPALKGGFQHSIPGLAMAEKLPEEIKPETTLGRWGQQAGGLIPDLPFMVAGGIIGGPNPITSAAGAFALPAAIKKVYYDKLAKGEIKNFEEFKERFGETLKETAKAYATGAATGAAGKFAPKGFKFPAELIAMTVTPAALEGRMPTMQESIDNAAIVLALKGSVYIAGKARNSIQEIKKGILKGEIKPEDLREVMTDAEKIRLNKEAQRSEVKPEAQVKDIFDEIAQPKIAPNVSFEETTTVQGKRMQPLLGANDNVIVAKDPKTGKELGYTWYTKEEGGGFTGRKIEVFEKRKGIATALTNNAVAKEGVLKGFTDVTPEGLAFTKAYAERFPDNVSPELKQRLIEIEGQRAEGKAPEFQLAPTEMPLAKPKAPVQEDSLKNVPSAMPSTAIETKDAGHPMLAEITQREEAKRQTSIPIKEKTVKTATFNPETDSLTDFVRKTGGLSIAKEALKGEIRDRYSIKEGYNLVNNKTGLTLDAMRERAVEEGFLPRESTVADFLDLLRRDVDSKKANTLNKRIWSQQKESYDEIWEAELAKETARLAERGSLVLPSLEKIKQFGKGVREFISPLSTLPKDVKEGYLTSRYKAMGWIDRVDDLVSTFNKKFKGILPENDKLLYQYLDGQIGAEKLPDNIKTTAHQMRNAQNFIGKMLVARGKLAPDVFEGNKNKYIRHSYLKHILSDENIMSNPSIKVDASYLKKRVITDLTRQKELGILEKASEAFPVSISKPLADIGKWDFHKKIINDSDLTWQPSMVKIEGEKRMSIGKLKEEIDLQQKIANQAKTPESQIRLDKLETAMKEAEIAAKKIPSDYIQLPMDSRYGELAGAVVKKPIARDLQPVFSGFSEKNAASKIVNTIIDIETKGMTAFKVAKTALNPPTWGRNAISGFVQNNMSGIPIWEMPVWMTKTALEIKNKGKHYVQAKRNGAFKTNFGEAEIAEILDTVKNMQNKTYPDILGALSKLGKYYGKIDDFYKLMKFIEQRESGASIGKAIIEAQKWNMDYSLAHPAVKLARRHAIPFASYTYKIAPLIAESLVKRPWVIAKYAAISYLMAEVVKSSLNLTDDDWEKLKKRLPLFIRQNQTVTPLPWKSPEGHVQWINLEYFFPWQQFNAIARDAYHKKYTELPSDIGIGNPFMDAYFATRTGKDIYTKQDIYNELDTPTEKALKASEFIWNKWGPGAFQRYGALGYTASIGEKDKYGRTITPAQAMGRWGGVNIIAPTPIQAAKELQFKKMELNIALNKILKDPTISTEKKKQTVKEYLKRNKELVE